MAVRVCIIGAGPSGMSAYAMLNTLKDKGDECHVTIYEKQGTMGGLWNLSWRNGTDEYGELVHTAMYRDLFSNGPKECLELPDYTFKDHFGRNIPAMPPREVLLDYLIGYWKFKGVSEENVKTRHSVRNVTYNKDSGTFSVTVCNLRDQKRNFTEEFDRVIVASGHFSVPNKPYFEGIEQFRGRVIHAKDFYDAKQFKGQRVLVIGASYSAEDMTLQLYKFGAKHITVSHRTSPMGFKWPDQVKEVPLLMRIEGGKTCHFKDGSSDSEFDAIILATGYQHDFPFMPTELTLETPNWFNLPNLYRNIQWYGATEGKSDTDGRLFYLGMQDQFYTFTMFMMQGLWTANVIKALITVPLRDECLAEIEHHLKVNESLADAYGQIDNQTAYLKDLSDDIGYTEDLDASQQFKEWEHHKMEDIVTFRDKVYMSLYLKEKSPKHPLPWLKAVDDSLEGWLKYV